MRTLWKPVMGLLCTVSMTSMAQAQDAQDSDAPEREVIIVTATLRAADVQDIPIAVTAVSPEQLVD
jgi:iron complex outermembrane receptor protein